MLVLGIESSCDETSISIVEDGTRILSNVVASQEDVHCRFGGVVPELACRRHIDVIIPVLHKSLQQAGVLLADIDLIAVAYAPGLIGALLIGLNAAKALSLSLGIPYIGVNHIEAHLYAAIMKKAPSFPCLGAVLSGGHTAVLHMDSIGEYRLLGQTVDDAIGEAYDKVARILGLPYPGGPHVERYAKRGNPKRFALKAGVVKGRPLDFSFSGIKTKVLYTVKGQDGNGRAATVMDEQAKADLCASFQESILQNVVQKISLAAQKSEVSNVILGGGVTCNGRLRTLLIEQPGLKIYFPPSELSPDNAAMIAGLGYCKYFAKGHGDRYDLEARSRIDFK